MTNYFHRKLNTLDIIKSLCIGDVSYIKYDPNLRKGQYSIRRQSTHDGTLLFTNELIIRAIEPLVYKQSFYKKDGYIENGDVEYVVGPLKHMCVYGKVWLPCSKTHQYPGQKERIVIPVIAKWK